MQVFLARGGAAGAASAAAVRLELAQLHGAAGRPQEALAECLAAEAGLEGVLPGDHPDVAAALWATGAALARAGRPQDALSRLHRAQHALAAARGGEHSDVAGVLQEIGGVLARIGSVDAALARFEEALEIYTAAGSLEGVAAVSNDVAIVFRKQGRHAEALARYHTALEATVQLKGDEHHDVLAILSNIAAVNFAQGDRNGAIAAWNSALGSLRKRRLTSDRETATLPAENELREAVLLFNIGLGHYELARYHEAADQLTAALLIRVRVLGENHLDTAHVRYALACAEEKLGPHDPVRFAKAKAGLLQVLDVRRKVFGEEHAEVADTLCALGAVQLAAGDPGEALVYFNQAHYIRVQRLGADDLESAAALRGAGQAQAEIGRSDRTLAEATAKLEQAEAVLARRLPSGHSDLLEIRRLIHATIARNLAECLRLQAEAQSEATSGQLAGGVFRVEDPRNTRWRKEAEQHGMRALLLEKKLLDYEALLPEFQAGEQLARKLREARERALIALPAGSRVHLTGLTDLRHKQDNGKVGTVTDADIDGARYTVELDNGVKMRVRGKNLLVLPSGLSRGRAIRLVGPMPAGKMRRKGLEGSFGMVWAAEGAGRQDFVEVQLDCGTQLSVRVENLEFLPGAAHPGRRVAILKTATPPLQTTTDPMLPLAFLSHSTPQVSALPQPPLLGKIVGTMPAARRVFVLLDNGVEREFEEQDVAYVPKFLVPGRRVRLKEPGMAWSGPEDTVAFVEGVSNDGLRVSVQTVRGEILEKSFRDVDFNPLLVEHQERVAIHGLKGSVQYNGKEGVICGFPKELPPDPRQAALAGGRGISWPAQIPLSTYAPVRRVQVRLDGGDEEISVKVTNLFPL